VVTKKLAETVTAHRIMVRSFALKSSRGKEGGKKSEFQKLVLDKVCREPIPRAKSLGGRGKAVVRASGNSSPEAGSRTNPSQAGCGID